MGQERKGVPESPGGHRRQPARRRHSGKVHRLLPMVHDPAGMHRHRRRTRHGMPGRRHGPVQGKLHPRRGAGIELSTSLRHRLRQGRRRGTDGRMTPTFHLVGEESPCLQPLCPRVPQTVIPAKAGISFPIRVQTVFRTPPFLGAPPLKPRRHHLKVAMPTYALKR